MITGTCQVPGQVSPVQDIAQICAEKMKMTGMNRGIA